MSAMENHLVGLINCGQETRKLEWRLFVNITRSQPATGSMGVRAGTADMINCWPGLSHGHRDRT